MPESPASPAALRAAAARGVRATLIGIAVSSLLAAVKIAAGILGNAYALIADGLESILDIFSALAVWQGLRIAAAPPDEEHPFGHGKAEALSALAAALALLGGAILIGVQSVREILTPHHAPAPWTLLVLIAVVAAKEALFRFGDRVARDVGSTAVRSDAWHHRSDALTSLAAFVGIGLAWYLGPGYEAADDWAALLACGVILFNGVKLLRTAVREVMDTAPPPEVEAEVRRLAAQVEGVRALDKCKVLKSGLAYFVDLQIRVNGDLSVREGHAIAHCVKDALMQSALGVLDVAVHVEPTE
ncbi:MAG: cation efflux system protein [Planctomycetota bacterium]